MTSTPPEVPAYGGCQWPVDPACYTEEWNALSTDVQDRSLSLASATLQRLTGNRVGNCPIKVRPVALRAACYIPAPMFDPMQPFLPSIDMRGQWVNNVGQPSSDPARISLPRPVGRVDEVKVNGSVLDQTQYAVEDGGVLVWTGGGASPFPLQQDLTLDDDQPGTMSVTYLTAYPVDAMGAYAVGVLALEFAKACTNGKKCRLPEGVTSIVRAGVAFTITPGLFPEGYTGIREVDAFISLWNPNGMKQAPSVWWPNRNRPHLNTAGGPLAPADIVDGGTP